MINVTDGMNQECTCKWARECVWVSEGNYNLFCFVEYLSAAPQLCALKDTNEKKMKHEEILRFCFTHTSHLKKATPVVTFHILL